MADQDDLGEIDDGSHRGGFGEFGGEAAGLIERTFRERIVLVGVTLPAGTDEETEESLDELALLVDTAGADAIERVVQRRIAPDPGTYLGRGKVEEVRRCSDSVDADTVVFDDELTPAQQFNLERMLGRTVLDRTAVILDIFAQNAHSQAGKVQVELAQLRYRLPRLRGKGLSLSQQAGGIGTRGPGETQLEIDRRRILRRIQKLERDLRDLERQRQVQRKARRRSDLPTVVIVGYTNAGKSTLLNRLTDAGVLVEDRLFATLDATTRRLRLPSGRQALLTDTVGFVRKLPHQLVEAFKSTLEVVGEADLLLHVVDGSSVDPDAEIAAVRDVLAEIGAGAVPELIVVNKLDLSSLATALARRLGGVAVSARTGQEIPELVACLDEELRPQTSVEDVVVPFERGEVMALVHRVGEVLSESACDDGMHYRVRLDETGRRRLAAEALMPGGG